ncbi:MAG: Na+/H+ antiporter subunit D [Actinomycetaceae bacterium]|nr:Na+/H+ antiporter subunit D [Actinomycetaceae bacterium]
MNLAWMLPIPVLLPLLSAGLALVVGSRPRIQQLIALVALVTSLVFGVILAVGADSGPIVLDVGSWAAPIGITLVADRLSSLMLVVSQIVMLSVHVYSLAQNLIDEGADVPVAIYHPTYLVLCAGVSNSFLTGDLFNLYVGFEILLAASFVLITIGGTRGRTRAGTVYVIVSLVSSLLFLIGIALTYAAVGTANMAQMSTRLREIDPSVALVIQLVLLVAFGIKAAVFPLAAWLPDSYPTAPAPVTAVFAGLLTKVGIYALIRLQVLLFPGEGLEGFLTFVGIATMIVGILGAIAQDDIRRLLSFTLVSHIGFMIWGLALVNKAGLAATIFYAAHHILVQTTLFLIVGLIERHEGSTSLRTLGGLAKSHPILSLMFFVAGLNLVGIPPFTGFIGKVGLAQASVVQGGWEGYSLLAAGMVTSFLTLYAFVKVWNFAFWQSSNDEHITDADPARVRTARQKRAVNRAIRAASERASTSLRLRESSRTKNEKERTGASVLMYASAGSLIGVMVAMTIGAGPMYAYASNAALDQMDRATYLHSVLKENGRGHGTSQYAQSDAPENLQKFAKPAQEDAARDVRHDDRTIPAEVRPTRSELWSHQWRPPYVTDDDPAIQERIENLKLTRRYVEGYPQGRDSR